MKKLFTLVAVLATTLSFNGLFAQCTINTSNTTAGFTPTSASVAQGAAINQTIQVYAPGTISTYTIDSIVVTGITGFPTGITYTLNPASGHIVTSTCGGNGEGSICLSGSTSDTVGTYALTFNGSIYIQGIGGLPISTIASQDPAFGFKLSVTAGVLPATCDTFADINLAVDTPTYYSWQSPSVGYASGNGEISNNSTLYPELGTAEEFTAGAGDSVTMAAIAFSYVTIKSTDSANLVKVYVYDGSSGTPGAAIDSASLSLAQIATAVTATNTAQQITPNFVSFTHGAALPSSNFFIGVIYPTTVGDTVVLFTNAGGTPYGRGYIDIAGQWFRYTEIVGGIDSLGDIILVSVCGSAFPPVAAFTQSVTSGCSPVTVTFTDASTGGTGYSWSFGDNGNSTSQNPSHTYTTAGTYTVTETVTNTSGSATFSSTVTVNASPVTTVDVTNATTSTSADGAAGVHVTGGTGTNTYAWSNSNTTDSISGVVAATYYVTVTNSNTCRTVDTVVVSFGSGINTLGANAHVKIYPNPANDQLNFEWNISDEATITIYDVTGQAIKTYMVNGSVSKLDIHEFASGLYVLRVVDKVNNEQQSLTFTKF
jgi:PKD repeat protein